MTKLWQIFNWQDIWNKYVHTKLQQDADDVAKKNTVRTEALAHKKRKLIIFTHIKTYSFCSIKLHYGMKITDNN